MNRQKNRSLMLFAILILVAVIRSIEGHRLSCSSDQFRCFNGKCIKRIWFCDGANDCEDHSDEAYCDFKHSNGFQRRRECPTEEQKWLLCANQKRCIPQVWRCDGIKDCLDGSDEYKCPNPIQEVAGTQEARKKVLRTLLSRKQSTHSILKWGYDLPKIATALYLTDPDFFLPTNETGKELTYEISLQLLSKFALKQSFKTYELSQYLNALLVTCINPRDFFGINVVAELRKRVDNSNYTNPFTILTLCNANAEMTSEDVNKVLRTFDSHQRALWTDTQALATLALSCLSKRSNLVVDDRSLTDMTSELKKKQHKNGTIESLTSTALVIQALLATDSYRNDFDLAGALKYMVHSDNLKNVSTMEAYYVLPVLSFKSLVNISEVNCNIPIKTDLDVLTNLRSKQDERIQVHFSVYVGQDIDFVRTWKLKVPSNYTLYQVLENVAGLEPNYKFKYGVSEGKPFVNGFLKTVDDAAEGMFWFTCKQALNSTQKPKCTDNSPVDIPVNSNEEFILWYKSGEWNDSS